ncbi:hypothetical protein L1987_21380 [Smallanthus sonchifolius]|uniref:Uncharacterized protein n=1 Tax=Smallanthus sonchifolius TaxID=185202 RepID=A0ACB9IVV8_9ASTR|nr:hypothetical protein L1987_21380 [Smallanthus sonchifolius]
MITSTRAILKLTSVRFQATNSSNGAAPPDSHNLTPPPPPPPPPRTSLLSVPKPSWIVRVCVSNMIRRDMKVMLHLLLQKERGVPQLIKNQNEGVVPSVPSVVEGGPNREVGLTTRDKKVFNKERKTEDNQLYFQAIVAPFFMNIYIVGLNHLFDIEIDKVNKLYLPLVSG